MDKAPPKPDRRGWGLLRRREILAPTWRGWLLLASLGALLSWGGLRGVYPFLAPNDPRPTRVMVIEGWVPDYCLKDAIAEFHQHHYDKMFLTGGPVDKGAPLAEFKSLPEMTAAVLFTLGMTTNEVVSIPAPAVPQDRTYASALALKQWWREHARTPAAVNLISVGPHARRSRLLFEKALGDRIEVGVIALTPRDFDPRHWWRTSQGFRTVTGEAIAYAYARVLFRRPREPVLP